MLLQASRVSTWRVAVLALVSVGVSFGATTNSALDSIRRDAAALAPLVHSSLAREFLSGCSALPPPPARIVFRDSVTRNYCSEKDALSQPASYRARLTPEHLDGLYYYQTRYGSILTYTRMFEILGDDGRVTFNHQRVLDFGYGRIGHLKALASLGATAVGIDVDPQLLALYSEREDQGNVKGAGGRVGAVRTVTGWFPGDSSTRAAIGTGYDLIISKNTLKGGHLPEERARQRRIVDLGVNDSVFVRRVAACLKPGGLFMMYTISGPMGNAGCPFSEELVRVSGFEIVAYDRDDSPGARAMMAALRGGQESEPSVSDTDVTARYTLLRMPMGTAPHE